MSVHQFENACLANLGPHLLVHPIRAIKRVAEGRLLDVPTNPAEPVGIMLVKCSSEPETGSHWHLQ